MCVCVSLLSRVQLFVTPWTVARQAPLSIGFSRQEYWSRLPYSLLQGIFPTQGSNPSLLHWPADDYLPFCPLGSSCICVHTHTHIYIHTHTHVYLHIIFFSIVIYPRLLIIVPCAIQYDLIIYPSYIYNSWQPQSVLHVCESMLQIN